MNAAQTRWPAIDAGMLEPIALDVSARAELRAATRHPVSLTWFGTNVTVRFADPLAAERYAARYRRFAAAPGEASLEGCALAAGGISYLWTEGGPAYRFAAHLRGETLDFLSDIVVRDAYFTRYCPFTSLHAAALACDGAALALCGASTGGKTTTALACTRLGMELYSDERCLFDGERVRAFPRALNVRAGALDLLCSDVPGDALSARLEPHRGSDWESVDPADLTGRRDLPEPLPPAAIFFIEARAERPILRPLTLAEAVPRTLAAPLRTRRTGLDRLPAALEILRRVRAYGLTLGTPSQTARALRDALRAAR
jgi:hypothetical protein